MPITRSDIPQSLLPGMRSEFFAAYNAPETNPAPFSIDSVERIATVIPSNKDIETYSWLGSAPGMREFIDERLLKGVSEQHYHITNKLWEASIGVDRTALEDDQYGQIRARIQELAFVARQHRIQLAIEALHGGTAALCYDGQYFFDSDHSTGASGTQSNLGTAALDEASLKAGITAMEIVLDDQARPMNLVPDCLVVAPVLKWDAMELLKSTYSPQTATNKTETRGNMLAGMLDLLVSPFITDTDSWYLLCTRRPLKPIIFQERTPIEFEALEGNSENGFMRDQYAYGVRERSNVGYGLWQMAYAGHPA